MKDFERIDELGKSRDRLIRAMYLARKKLRADALKEKPSNGINLMTAALAIDEILFQYSELVKDDLA